MEKETIAAIATGLTNAGIGIVRMSGEDVFRILKKMFRTKGGADVEQFKSHTVHYGYVTDGDEVIDEAIVIIMRKPRSYTGEDTVEIDCHGGVFVTRRVLEIALKCGARAAEPGEFTKRAFLAGRIDLSQAEAVSDIINSENEYALQSSVGQLRGGLRDKIVGLRKKILEKTSYIEAALDDPEHMSLDGFADGLKTDIERMTGEITALIETFENGRIIKEGVKVAIVGKPNAGKSSLLNALTGRDRAIVTDIKGTTRDILEEEIVIDGLNFRFADMAGIRRTDDAVEKIGVERAGEYVKNADAVLYIVDSARKLDEDDAAIAAMLEGKRAVALLNKCDLKSEISEKDVKKIADIPIIKISAKEDIGISDMKKYLSGMFLRGEIRYNDEVTVTNLRHLTALKEANASLRKVTEAIRSGLPEDFYTIDLTDAYNFLGLIIGEQAGDDLIDEIFGKFCVGK